MLLYPWQRLTLAQAARKQGLVGDIHLGDSTYQGFQLSSRANSEAVRQVSCTIEVAEPIHSSAQERPAARSKWRRAEFGGK
jgi:hypothetical protein